MTINLSEKLSPILSAELAAGNKIGAEYRNAFKNCDLFVMLQKPFHADDRRALSGGVICSAHHDTHYPVGVDCYDESSRHTIFAPFGWRDT